MVLFYVWALALGIEVGDSDREIRDYYEDPDNRAKEVVDGNGGALTCIDPGIL